MQTDPTPTGIRAQVLARQPKRIAAEQARLRVSNLIDSARRLASSLAAEAKNLEALLDDADETMDDAIERAVEAEGGGR